MKERLRYVGRDTESFAWLVPTHPNGTYESQVHFMDEKTKAFPGLGVQPPGVLVWRPVHGQTSPLPFLPFLCPVVPSLITLGPFGGISFSSSSS